MVDASDGHYVASVSRLLASAVFVALFLALWSWALERVSTTADPIAGGGRVGRAVLFPRWMTFLPRNRVGAVAAREVRYLMRDPKRRVALLPTLLMPFLPLLTTLGEGGHASATAPFAALLTTFVAAQLTLNQFGLDGSAYWTNVAAGNDPEADLTGKNLATVITTLPLVTAVALVLAALGGGWAYVPAVLGLSLAVLAIELGIGNVVSVRAPQGVPESRSNLWANNTGQGCIAGLVSLLALVAVGVLVVPIAIAVGVALSRTATALIVVVPASIAYGGVVWWLGRRSAVRWVWWRQPELLDAISVRHSG
jgi:ABC-2 type transport system permease protein